MKKIWIFALLCLGLMSACKKEENQKELFSISRGDIFMNNSGDSIYFSIIFDYNNQTGVFIKPTGTILYGDGTIGKLELETGKKGLECACYPETNGTCSFSDKKGHIYQKNSSYHIEIEIENESGLNISNSYFFEADFYSDENSKSLNQIRDIPQHQ